MTKKLCSKCKTEKPLSEFYNAKKGKFGKRGSCIECDRNYQKSYNYEKREPKDEERRAYELAYSKNYYIENKSSIMAKRKNRYQIDPKYRLRMLLTCRLSIAVKRSNSKQKGSTLKLLGCSLVELKLHLESKFKEGMSWDNYGMYGWHIDHIQPCSKFDLTKIEEQEKCFHYSNLQPLWAIDNLKKGCK